MHVSAAILLILLISTLPAQSQTRIMPIGDSITKGIGGSGDNRGFRKPLFNLLKNAYSIDFVGSRTDGDGTFDENHEGHPGKTAEFINDNISSYLNSADPDIAILHIGTNDISLGVAANDIVSNIDAALSKIWTYDPALQVLLCGIAPRTTSNTATRILGEEIKALVNNRGQNYPVAFVDIFHAISWRNDWEKFAMADSVHPNDTGYQIMADAFFEALRPFLSLVTPVELIAFTAHVVEADVALEWTTASETNNYGFEIEHGANGGVFEQLAFIPGHGTTFSPHHYSFQHRSPNAGRHFYRLRQIDADGAFGYSPTVEVFITQPEQFTLSATYPNPFSPQSGAGAVAFEFGLKNASNISIRIHDILGREIVELFSGRREAGIQRLTWNGRDRHGFRVPAGSYFISLHTPQGVKRQQLTVIY